MGVIMATVTNFDGPSLDVLELLCMKPQVKVSLSASGMSVLGNIFGHNTVQWRMTLTCRVDVHFVIGSKLVHMCICLIDSYHLYIDRCFCCMNRPQGLHGDMCSCVSVFNL